MDIIGLMSGTSLDGLDIAHCSFENKDGKYSYQINAAETISFPDSLLWKIKNAQLLSGRDLMQLDAELGIYFGEKTNEFLCQNKLRANYIASHGQTIFHEPANGFTTQIGHGAHIYAQTQIPTICDFRSLDVALGGNGAPLVPIGDLLLFNEFDFCLNLGGFANISIKKEQNIEAFDICACNYVLNYLCNKIDLEYDENGKIASENEVDSHLIKELDNLAFYKTTGPKSLGREWVEKEIFPILENADCSVEQKIATFSEHIAQQISYTLHKNFAFFGTQKLLVTGGGAYNQFIISKMQKYTKNNLEIIVPTNEIINFKEALIFAFLGYLKVLGKDNTLKSVTGATKNSIGGVVYGG